MMPSGPQSQQGCDGDPAPDLLMGPQLLILVYNYLVGQLAQQEGQCGPGQGKRCCSCPSPSPTAGGEEPALTSSPPRVSGTGLSTAEGRAGRAVCPQARLHPHLPLYVQYIHHQKAKS